MGVCSAKETSTCECVIELESQIGPFTSYQMTSALFDHTHILKDVQYFTPKARRLLPISGVNEEIFLRVLITLGRLSPMAMLIK